MTSDAKATSTFRWLNATQFFGAFNDNVFKLFIIFFLIGHYGQDADLQASAGAMALFVVPFLLFATTGGYLADRFSKKQVIVGVKALELCVMGMGCAAFWLGSVPLLCVALFLMAMQSALFGPSKFGIIPELVGREELSHANSLLSAFSYLAIVLGTAAGPFIARTSQENYAIAGAVCVAVALVGLGTSVFIERTPAARSDKRPSLLIVSDVWRTLVDIRRDRYLLLAVLASAYFLLIGAFVQINLIPYGMQALGMTKTASGYLFIVAGIGIGLGALAAGRLSGKNVEFGVVPIGALVMTASTLLLAVIPSSLPLALVLILITGVGVGLFVIPVNAFIQYRSPRARIGEILAASSFLSWVGVLVTAVSLYAASTWLGLTARQGFVVVAVLTLLLTILCVRVLPDFMLRFIGVLLTRLCYRIRVIGFDNYPVEGPALFISNHVSYVDAFLIGVLRPRRVRFMMNREMYEIPWLNPMLRLLGVIPVSFNDPPKRIIASFRAARRALAEGFIVCVFAEGTITRSGLPRAFKSGFERIVKGTQYPIVPVYLGGVWGSVLSYYHGSIRPRWPQQFPHPVTVLFGKPLPPSTPATAVRQAVIELAATYFDSMKPTREPVGRLFAKTARKNWGRPAMTDTTGRRLTYGEALTAAIALGGVLAKTTAGQQHVGVLLPSTCGGALTNVALTLMRKVPVNLNYTASAAALRSAAVQCEIRTTITSRAFLQKLGGLEAPGNLLYLEDVSASLSSSQKLSARLKARLWPMRWLAASRDFDADELLTIIFSSGSTGDPKGVMLSHHNIVSNIEALRMVFRLTDRDRVCAVLPFFHSFGYTGNIWFPLLSGIAADYHPSPLDGAGVAEVIKQHRCTLLFSTPTFLTTYMRRAKREDFATLRLVIAGAEKLKARTADAFEKRFGIRPLEGYGATELSPVGALNIPDAVVGRLRQMGTKEGTVGHPLPGVAMKVIDTETHAPLPPEREGLLLVKGPNVMVGYLGRADETEEVLRDGWYVTGDIARMDRDGFVTITDRQTRFSKIGGEMIPHLAIEEAYHQALGLSDQALAVTAVPDEKRGERLVVLFTPAAGRPERLQQAIAQVDLPNIWKPDRNSYFAIEHLPLLGSGKLDLKMLKDLALDAVAPASQGDVGLGSDTSQGEV